MFFQKIDELTINFSNPGAPPYAPNPAQQPYLYETAGIFGNTCYGCTPYPIMNAENGAPVNYDYELTNQSGIYFPVVQIPGAGGQSFLAWDYANHLAVYYNIALPPPNHTQDAARNCIWTAVPPQQLSNNPSPEDYLFDIDVLARPGVGFAGVLHFSNAGPVAFINNGNTGTIDSLAPGGTYNTIIPDGGGVGAHHNQLANISGAAGDFSLIQKQDNSWGLCQWGGGYQSIVLSNATDNALLNSLLSNLLPGFMLPYSNGEWLQISAVALYSPNVSQGLMFMFNKDMNAYRRININLDQSASDGVFATDINGQMYLCGTDAIANNGYVQLADSLIPPAPPSPSSFVLGPSITSYGSDKLIPPAPVIGLGCWSPCAILLQHGAYNHVR